METSIKPHQVKKTYKKIFLEKGDVIYMLHNNEPIWRFKVEHRSGKYVKCKDGSIFFSSMIGGIQMFRGFSFYMPRTFELETPELKITYWRNHTVKKLDELIQLDKFSNKQLSELYKFVKQITSTPNDEKQN